MNKKNIAYSVNSRVIWLSDKIYHVPVLGDLYRTHQIQDLSNINEEECYHYSVKLFHKFAQDKLVYAPLKSDEAPDVLLSYQKMKSYEKLCSLINAAYLTTLPIVFFSEEEKVQILAESFISVDSLNEIQKSKNLNFVNGLISEKKKELKKRYLKVVFDLKNAQTLDEVQTIDYTIVYEGLNII